MLSAITPVILTWDEAPNIGRVLACLDWAGDIVVVDSGSTDATLSLLKNDPRIRLYTRAFDTHEKQWEFATSQTGITAPWILRLDADYILPKAFIDEMAGLDLDGAENAYRASFDYAIYSRILTASLYPPNTILLRRGCFSVRDAGHTEAWAVTGRVGALKAHVVHDDWKTMSRWVGAQVNYMSRELSAGHRPARPLRDWLRRHPPLMPVVVFSTVCS